MPTYLGFDFSTQQIKALLIDDDLKVLSEASVQFDKDLPEFKTNGGVHVHEDNKTVTAPPEMWVKAFDMVLDRMKEAGTKFCDVAAISGSGQQHGSVYWRDGASETLGQLSSDSSMFDQLKDSFSVGASPVWMDSSTLEQCRALEAALGGPEALSRVTGSVGLERFTGNQIAKVFQTNPQAYGVTERISLVSSFAASLCLGAYAAIDTSDGSGMNLLDITSRTWSQACLDACAPGLRGKLGDPVFAGTVLGSVSSYLADRYGFSPDCKVVASTGDNPASLAGMCLEGGDIAVSLGTSDTLFAVTDKPSPALEGSVLCSPVHKTLHMLLMCYKNGSLTRERIRDEVADESWDKFNSLLASSSPGNKGNIGIYFDKPEIAPPCQGVYRFNDKDEPVDSFDAATEVRALLEGQFMNRRVHAELLGYSVGSGSRILATGGASNNTAILQVMSDVFGAEIYTLDIANSACLGAAYRAKHGLVGGEYGTVINGTSSAKLAASPTPGSAEIYGPLCERYKKLEGSLLTR